MATDAELLKEFSELRGVHGRFMARIKKMRRYYDLDFENEVLPPGARARGFKPVVPRTARRSIDENVDHILTHPKVKVPIRPTDSNYVTEQEIAEKKRKAILAWWRQCSQRFNTIGDARKWLILDGKIAVRQTLRWDLIPDAPEKGADPKEWAAYRRKLKDIGRTEFLWRQEILDNDWVYEDPGDHRNPGFVFVAFSLYVDVARKMFPEASGEWRNRPSYSKVQFLEYWSAPEWNDDGTWTPGDLRQWVDQELVKSDDNPYPYIPIAIEDAGYGLNHVGTAPEDKYVGLLDHSVSVIVAQGRQWSSMEAVAEMTAFNPVKTRNMSDEDIAKLEIGPGAVWQMEGASGDPNAQDVELQQWPDIPLTVMQMLQLTDREVNSSLKTDTLGGIAQKGVDTASEADQNVRNASAKLTNPVEALSRLAAKLTRWMLMDIELVLEAPVTLYGTGAQDNADIRLTPREINGYYDCTVQLSTTDEEALESTKAKLWSDLYRILPFLSAFTAMERGGISDDPLFEMLKRGAEDVYLSPEMTQIRVATGAQTFGELMAYIAQLQAQQGGGGAQQPGSLPGDEQMTTDESLATPPGQTAVVDQAYDQRNVNQVDQAYAGGY